MKVNIKGLVFVGFAAAILSGAAKADDKQIVTSKSYTDATYQTKIAGGTEAGKVVVAGETAGAPTYLAFDDTPTASSTNLVKSGAIQAAIAASQTATTYTGSDGITLTDHNFTNSGIRDVTATDANGANGTITINKNGTTSTVAVKGLAGAAYVDTTTDTTFAVAADTGKLPTASTVKSYVDATANAKVENNIVSDHTTIAPSGAAVASGLATKQPITTSQANFQVGGASGAWKEIATDSYIGIADGEAGTANEGKAVITINATTDGTLASENEGRLPTAAAVKTYVASQITDANLGQYQAEQIGAAANSGQLLSVDSEGKISMNTAKITSSVTSGSGDVVTSGAVYTYVNGQLVPVPGATCSASTPCALVATGATMSDVAWVQMAQSN